MKEYSSFEERFAKLDDESLAHIFTAGNLVPEAEQALRTELSKRKIDNLSAFKDPLDQDMQNYKDDLRALRALPLWRRVSVPLAGLAAVGIMSEGYFLPRYYISEHFGVAIAGLQLAVVLICLCWFLSQTPMPPKH
jgi:hypothetical protein